MNILTGEMVKTGKGEEVKEKKRPKLGLVKTYIYIKLYAAMSVRGALKKNISES